MDHAVVHFEIIGPEPDKLRDFYGELFGWEFDLSGTVSEQVSDPDDYGFLAPIPGPGGGSIPGGVGGGRAYDPHVVLYVGVSDVEQALARAQELGGHRRMGPATAPSGLVIGHFNDPAGNLIGLASAT
jgi:hypothetical protein